MRTYTSISGLVLLAVALAISLMRTAAADPQKRAQQAEPAVALRVAVLVGSPKPMLAFTVSYNTQADLEALDVAANPYRFVVVKPDGSQSEHFSIIDYDPRREPVPTVKPGASKTWKVAPEDALYAHKEPGMYRLTWHLLQLKDKKVVTYKSNEVLLLVEPKPNK